MKLAFVLFLVMFLTVGNCVAQKTSVITAGVLVERSQKQVENLVKEDFRIFVNGKEQKIISVKSENRPLSLVILSTLGEGKSCGSVLGLVPDIFALKNNMKRFGKIIQENIKAEDEVAVFVTDEDSTRIRKFSDSRENLPDNFAEITRISEELEKVIESEELSQDAFGQQTTSTSSYIGVEENFIFDGLLQSIAYLRKTKKEGNRPAILLIRSIYNAPDIIPADIEKLKKVVFQDDLAINWFGESDETIFKKIANSKKLYNKIPALTGGIKKPCSLLKGNKNEELEKEIKNLFANLRQGYSLTYQTNETTSPDVFNEVEIKLSKEGRKKVKEPVEIRHQKLTNSLQETMQN